MASQPSIYFVEKIGKGILAIMPRPRAGKDGLSPVFGAIAEHGFHRVVSLLEPEEVTAKGLGECPSICEQHGMLFINFPMRDRGIPRSVKEFGRFTRMLHDTIERGVHTVVHCRLGIGRSGVLAAGILLQDGLLPKNAFEVVSAARGFPVPNTEAQRKWLITNQHKITSRKKRRLKLF